MLAKKCDRCGKLYEDYGNSKEFYLRIWGERNDESMVGGNVG